MNTGGVVHRAYVVLVSVLVTVLLLVGVSGNAAIAKDKDILHIRPSFTTFDGVSSRGDYVSRNSSDAGRKKEPNWQERLHKSIFPDYREFNNQEFGIRAGKLSRNYSRPNFYGDDDSSTRFFNDRDREQSLAREETYRIASNLMNSLSPVAKLKEALKPFMKPFELYREEDGTVTAHSFFKGGQTRSGNAVKLFSLNVTVSSKHNLNVVMNFYDKVSVALYDGNKVEMTYVNSEKGYKLGLRKKGEDELMFLFKFEL